MTSTDPFRLRDIAVAAYGPTLVNAIGHGAVLPIVALQARALGADVGTAALVVAMFGIGPLLASLPAGALVARVGERRALLGAGVVDAAALVLAASADHVAVLALALVGSGATWSVFLLARQAFMIDVVPFGYRARALSALGGSMRIGLFLGPLLGAGVIHLWGMPATFLLAAVMSLAAASIAVTMPDLSAEVRAVGDAQGHLKVLEVMRRHRRVLLTVGTAVVVLGASRAVRSTVLPLWADHIGLSARDTSLVFAVAAGVDMLLFYPAGWLMDRYGRMPTAVSVTGAIALGVLLLPLTHSAVAFTAVGILMAIGNGLGSGIVMTLGADHAPQEGRAQFLGAWRLCGDLGVAGGPLLVSLVAALAPLAVACLVVGAVGVAGTGWVGWTTRGSTARVEPAA